MIATGKKTTFSCALSYGFGQTCSSVRKGAVPKSSMCNCISIRKVSFVLSPNSTCAFLHRRTFLILKCSRIEGGQFNTNVIGFRSVSCQIGFVEFGRVQQLALQETTSHLTFSDIERCREIIGSGLFFIVWLFQLKGSCLVFPCSAQPSWIWLNLIFLP